MPAAAKLDLYKQHKAEYVTPKTPTLVDVGPATYLAIDGKGAPGGEAFQAAVGALYGVAFTIKMARKFAGKGDYKVCHLEGLWWAGDTGCDFQGAPPSQWRWKLLIRVPDFIAAKDLKDAVAALRKKGKPETVAQVRLETLKEGRCVQMLHVGPYDQEAATIEKMHALAAAHGLALGGPHHEIYLSDPRRVPAARLRTLLRHPVR